MSKLMERLVSNSLDEHIKYSHDCWGSTTSDTYHKLNVDKLTTIVVKEILNLINEQIAVSSIEQNQALYTLKHKVIKHFDAKL